MRETKWYRNLIIISCAVGIAMFWSFFFLYHTYIQKIIYEERLNQMEEVTHQLFQNLEDVINARWEQTAEQCRYMEQMPLKTVDELYGYMTTMSELSGYEERGINLIAVDADGKWYTKNGNMGLLREPEYFENKPERINYVSSALTNNQSQMVFLKRLPEPFVLQNGDKQISIHYFGTFQRMEQLNNYFDCDAYGNNNSVYVLDNNGSKLFNSNHIELVKGYNVFSVLKKMEYRHDSSFNGTLRQLEETGSSYSNAVLDGTEYFYALKRLKNAQWTLIFLVPAKYVATNTLELVHFIMFFIIVFATVLGGTAIAAISLILKRKQQEAILVERENTEKLEAVNEELWQAKLVADEAVQEAQTANRAKTEFLANMSHDIRTPMNAIVGLTKLMEHEKNDPEKLDAYIKKVQTSSRYLLGLINDILDMSRIESGGVKLNRESISLAELVEQVDNIIRQQAQERQQTFIIRANEITHEMLIADSVRFRQVFINLLSNAVKYTPNGGTITLELKELPCAVIGHAAFRIAVSDTGYGMAPEFVEHIFEPFTRFENSTTNKIQGTGLGMAITKSIVDMNGGSIRIQSELGKGSRFEVDLTFEIDKEAKPETEIKSVLLITREEQLIRNVKAAFKESDMELSAAASVEQTQTLLEEHPVQAIVLNGFTEKEALSDAVRRLREKTAEGTLIFCCDYTQSDALRDTLAECGVNGKIPRPFFLTNFVRAVDQATGETKQNTAETDNSLRGMRFLCAEDNALNAEILEAIMDMQGASCVVYPNGAELVKAFADVKPDEFDAILMDVQMPVMNGLDATRAVRASDNPLGRTIPIIAMTANAFSSDVQACLNAGMDAHVSKPLDISVLERTLKIVAAAKFSGGGSGDKARSVNSR